MYLTEHYQGPRGGGGGGVKILKTKEIQRDGMTFGPIFSFLIPVDFPEIFSEKPI